MTCVWLFIILGLTLIPSTRQDCPGVTISQKTLDENVVQVEWFNDEKYVYVMTKSSVYVSHDEGVTWNPVNTLGTGVLNELYLTPDPKKQFVLEFTNKESTLWRTSDHGSTWSQIKLTDQVFDVYPHPTDADWIFVHTFSPGCINSSSSCSYNLYLTQDFVRVGGRSVKEFSVSVGGRQERVVSRKSLLTNSEVKPLETCEQTFSSLKGHRICLNQSINLFPTL